MNELHEVQLVVGGVVKGQSMMDSFQLAQLEEFMGLPSVPRTPTREQIATFVNTAAEAVRTERENTTIGTPGMLKVSVEYLSYKDIESLYRSPTGKHQLIYMIRQAAAESVGREVFGVNIHDDPERPYGCIVVVHF